MATATVLPATNNDEWTKAGGNVADAAASVTEMAGHAANAVGNMAKQAASEVGKKADSLTAQAGSGIEHLGNMLSDNTPHDGMLGAASQAVAQTVQRGGRYLEEAKLSGAAETLTQLVRQHPVAAVMTAVTAGFLIGRALKN